VKRELAELRTKVDSVGQLVGYSLLQQRSTSERLQTVLATLDNKNPNQKVLGNLIGALALDPSVNVRLSALDALYPHADQQLVRSGVLASLPREQNPLVQVAMIDFLVAARDRDATPELEKIARNETVDRAVRDAAKRGLAQL
jgi:DNA polymerase III alpha subunit